MNFYEGLIFFVALSVSFVPAIVLGIAGKPVGKYAGLVSLVFLYLIFRDSPKQLWFIVGYTVYAALLVKSYLLIRKKKGKSAPVYYIYVVLSLLPLVATKVGEAMSIKGIGFLGISYITFRVVQIIIETYDGVIEKMPIGQFVSFLLFFPSFSSGPIDRSRRFGLDFQNGHTTKAYLDLLGNGLFKIVLGLVYKLILSAIAYKYLTTVFATSFELKYLIGYGYCYGIYLFFDFAGYSLMAVGTSYILGIQMPDNFNKPFLSKNISDFWNRWHISLSHWFRDFIFSRLMMKAIKNKWFKSKLTGACVCLIINMTIMGIWHGIGFSYIAYGVYHGILLAVNEVWQKKSNFYKKHKKDKWYTVLSWFVTLNLVMFGFLIFSGRFSQALLHLLSGI